MVINMNKKKIKIFLMLMIMINLLFGCQSNINLKNVSLPQDDFAYPTKDPSVLEGKKFFAQNCAQCHSFGTEAGKKSFTLKYINSVTPSELFKIITSDKKHPSFKDKLTIKDRWDIVMYLRYALFGYPENFEDTKIKFGANCAVCHGTRGFGDGDIHYFLNPPPANFNQFDKFYERTDEHLFDRISNGKPWTAMPPWANRVDKEKHFVFDEKFRWELVRYVRHFGYVTEKDILEELKTKELKEHNE